MSPESTDRGPAELPVSVKGVVIAPLPLSDDLEVPEGYRRSIEQAVAKRRDGDQPRPASSHG